MLALSEDVNVHVADLDCDDVRIDGVNVKVKHEFLLGGKNIFDAVDMDVDKRFGGEDAYCHDGSNEKSEDATESRKCCDAAAQTMAAVFRVRWSHATRKCSAAIAASTHRTYQRGPFIVSTLAFKIIRQLLGFSRAFGDMNEMWTSWAAMSRRQVEMVC